MRRLSGHLVGVISLQVKRSALEDTLCAAPLIGEDNEEIYIKELGFSKEELVLLKEANVI